MKALEFLFGCTHKHLSFPLSIRGGKKCKPYVVCLSCGCEWAYDWNAMCRGEELHERRLRA
jgi:hypothetical protein